MCLNALCPPKLEVISHNSFYFSERMHLQLHGKIFLSTVVSLGIFCLVPGGISWLLGFESVLQPVWHNLGCTPQSIWYGHVLSGGRTTSGMVHCTPIPLSFLWSSAESDNGAVKVKVGGRQPCQENWAVSSVHSGTMSFFKKMKA